MFEVIYISPSCRQAAEFIDRLFWDLRKNEVYDTKIDPGKLQLKSEKFIVSAVDIFGGKLGLSHEMTEYYIDMVSGCVFPRNCTKTCALERMKELKCTFREWAKEISEEELVGILTEVSE